MSRAVTFFLMFILLMWARPVKGSDFQREFYHDIVDNGAVQYTGRVREALTGSIRTQDLDFEPVFGKLTETLGGGLQEARISLKHGFFNHLPVEEALFKLEKPVIDVQRLWDSRELELKSCGNIQFRIVVLEKALNDFLQQRTDAINVRNPEVRLLSGQIVLNGHGEVFKMNVRFQVRGEFRVRDRRLIDFLPDRVKFSSVPIPKMLLGNMIERINPVLDLADFPFDLRLEKLVTLPGMLIFSNGDPTQ
ncbi:MAG: DUF2993 domain-containing protein [Candidatus Wallbacteria bacterium]|nr:DUF2993 domain-containing protein [Candidatus Wallbacteria bacterium]